VPNGAGLLTSPRQDPPPAPAPSCIPPRRDLKLVLSGFDLKSVWDVGYAERGVVGGLIACCLIFPAALFAPLLGCDTGYQPPRNQLGQPGSGAISPTCETLTGRVTGESTSAIFDQAVRYELIGFGLAAALWVGLAYFDAREKSAVKAARTRQASLTRPVPPASPRGSPAAKSVEARARAAGAAAAPGPPPGPPAAKPVTGPSKVKRKAVRDVAAPASASDSERWHDF
jgi:hypothetical protein